MSISNNMGHKVIFPPGTSRINSLWLPLGPGKPEAAVEDGRIVGCAEPVPWFG